MKIITKKRELEIENRARDYAMSLAERVYEQTLKWCGNNDAAIPDKRREILQMLHVEFITWKI